MSSFERMKLHHDLNYYHRELMKCLQIKNRYGNVTNGIFEKGIDHEIGRLERIIREIKEALKI